MANIFLRLQKMNTQLLQRRTVMLAVAWALICSAPISVVASSLQEGVMRSDLTAKGVPVTAVVTAHGRSRNSCAMYFSYYWKRSYETSIRGCPKPVGETFVALVNPVEPTFAIPQDQTAAMERTEFWEVAFFGGIALIVSLLILPNLCLNLIEVVRRALRRT